MSPPYIYPYASGAASCKSQQEKITQLENTFLDIKFVFLLSYFFLLTFNMKRPYLSAEIFDYFKNS